MANYVFTPEISTATLDNVGAKLLSERSRTYFNNKDNSFAMADLFTIGADN
jgi:hypothetical protein